MRHAFAGVLVAVGTLAATSSALAAASVTDGTAGAFAIRSVYVPAGCTVTAMTTGLSAGADPILHVQAPNGAFVAGNDDYAGMGTGSRVDFYQSTAQTLTFLVRAYDASYEGSGTLSVQQSGAGCGSAYSSSIVFKAGLRVDLGSTAWNTRLRTIQPPGGSTTP